MESNLSCEKLFAVWFCVPGVVAPVFFLIALYAKVKTSVLPKIGYTFLIIGVDLPFRIAFATLRFMLARTLILFFTSVWTWPEESLSSSVTVDRRWSSSPVSGSLCAPKFPL